MGEMSDNVEALDRLSGSLIKCQTFSRTSARTKQRLLLVSALSGQEISYQVSM